MIRIDAPTPEARYKAWFDLQRICIEYTDRLRFDSATGEVLFLTELPSSGVLTPCHVVALLDNLLITQLVIHPILDPSGTSTAASATTIVNHWTSAPTTIPLCAYGMSAWPAQFGSYNSPSVLTRIDVIYDATDYPSGAGYLGYTASGGEIPVLAPHLLAFGLGAAASIANQLADREGVNAGTPYTIDTSLSLKMENAVRTSFGAGEIRSGPLELYHPSCSQQPGKRSGPPPPPPRSAEGWKWPGVRCFVATAAYGSVFADEVQLLRRFRDDVLRATRTGDEWFERFYREYYEVSPAIAERMRADPDFGALMRVGIVQPYVNWLELAATFPDAPIDDVPEPWHGVLATLIERLDSWATSIGMPEQFDDMIPTEIASELALILRFGFRDRARRREYLDRLTAKGVLPLPLSREDAIRARRKFEGAGLEPGTVERLVPAKSEQEVQA